MKLTIRSVAISFFIILQLVAFDVKGDDYKVASGNKSLLVALGCFWCAEQAFEQYAPGVIEAVSGYAGANGIDNPRYQYHPGHYEVILIEYDPAKTSYSLLVQYAFRNLDPFDSFGQFCDKGSSYLPAIFYATEEERVEAEGVLNDILVMYPTWDASSIAVPILERPKFWKAEEYHQNYYIKNPGDYGYYKNACGRTKRLKSVWGDEEYYCYHDFDTSCFNNTVVNADGVEVNAEVNRKDVPVGTAGLMPQWVIILLVVGAAILVCLLSFCLCKKVKR
mmetsp:Transcript_16400/g.34672  ORF Transcript_16400/g.34672 Transcript_16400/m.34672 type:complete len:278 (-) Transcript_16400:267-1100(-)